MIASFIIYFYPEANIADPICTMIFAVIILFTTIPLVKSFISFIKDGIYLLMEATPEDFELKKFIYTLKCIKNVEEVHGIFKN